MSDLPIRYAIVTSFIKTHTREGATVKEVLYSYTRFGWGEPNEETLSKLKQVCEIPSEEGTEAIMTVLKGEQCRQLLLLTDPSSFLEKPMNNLGYTYTFMSSSPLRGRVRVRRLNNPMTLEQLNQEVSNLVSDSTLKIQDEEFFLVGIETQPVVGI